MTGNDTDPAADHHRSLVDLRALSGIKWAKYPDDVLCAWVADMDLGTAPAVVDELRTVVDTLDLGYHKAIYDEVADLAVERQAAWHGWRPDRSHVRLFDDVLQAIEAVLWFCTPDDAGVILHTPVYPPFHAASASGRRRIVSHPMHVHNGRWEIDPAAEDAVAAESPAAMILCNPHNPTGRVFDRDELEAVAAFAERLDLIVIADEVHAELLHPGATHIPFASLGPDVAARTVTIGSASKSFNLASLRCAFAVIDHDGVRSTLDALPEHLVGQINAPGARATAAAWRSGDGWLAATKTLLTRNLDHAAARLAAELPEIGVIPPEATYLMWLDCRALDLGPSPSRWFLDHARVALSPGEEFGPGGEGFVRLNVATSPEILDQVLDRLVTAVRAR